MSEKCEKCDLWKDFCEFDCWQRQECIKDNYSHFRPKKSKICEKCGSEKRELLYTLRDQMNRPEKRVLRCEKCENLFIEKKKPPQLKKYF